MKRKSIFGASIIAAAFVAGTAYNVNSAQALVAGTNLNVSGVVPTITVGATGSSNVYGVSGVSNVSVGRSGSSSTEPGLMVNTAVNGGNPGNPANLDAYVQTMSANDASVSSVDTSSDNQVSVEYKRPAKLFGFISVDLPETAMVSTDANGTVSTSVHKPWWSIFVSSAANTGQFLMNLQSRVQGDTAASASAAGTAQMSASQKAAYLADINAAAQATYNNGSGDASVNSSASY